MKKNKIEDFSLDELKLIKSFIETHNDVNTMISEVDKVIDSRINGINYRLTIELMEELHFFDREVFDILKSHNIKNIQDLIDSDLEEWNLTKQRRLELEEAKLWYNFDRLGENLEKIKKKTK